MAGDGTSTPTTGLRGGLCMCICFHFHSIAVGVIAVASDAEYSKMIGRFLLTASGRFLIFDVNQNPVVNQTFPHMEELPLESGIWQTAKMAVINNVAYIGGRNGIVYLLRLPIDHLAKVFAGSSDFAAGAHWVTVTNITLPFSCIVEAFAHTADGVIAACFSNENSTLYIVNVHSPSDKNVPRPLQFTPLTDFSNVVPVKDVVYFVQHDHLLRADIARGETQVAPLEHCGQAWITTNEQYSIIIECENTSFVYVPEELSDAYGIKYGAWKNRDVHLKPCHGTTFVFSVDDTVVTIYDYRNDLNKRISLTGNPDTTTLLCTQNDGNLTLLNRDKTCNCWIQHLLTEQYEIKASNFIPHSEGTLPPLQVGNNRTIPQSALQFNDTYFLLPATHQFFVDLHNNIVHPMITDDIVVFHAGIDSVSNSDSGTGNSLSADSNDDPTNDSNDKQWPVYVLVPVVVLLVVAAAGFLAYKQKRRILMHWNNICIW